MTRKIIAAALLLLSTLAFAQKRDPLTDAEADQLREVAMEPQKRLKLFIKFTEARLDAIDQARSDPAQAQGRGRKIHDLLQDFTSLIDEINDNLDQYEGRLLDKDHTKDFHKGVKEVISAEERFRARLRTLQHQIETDPQTKLESRDYAFTLQDAQDALKASLETAREYSQEKKDEKDKHK
ncbi:MAG: hypothetical protein ACM3SW_00035 [Actinomycetota bacterium]